MKKFIAFINGSNSGIQTHEKAVEWAQNQMTAGKWDKIHIAEVIEVVERTVPAVKVNSFFVALEGDDVSKAA